MIIAIGSDHAGFLLKEEIKRYLSKRNISVIDVGASSNDISVDYPDFANKVSKLILSKKADKGILVCGTGIGMSIGANRHKKIRAALCYDIYTAKMARMHNDANVLCIGARTTEPKTAKKIVGIFLSTDFEGGRHKKRVRKLG